MKNLGNLKPNPGSRRDSKRLGRGPGSGLGKTGGKGHKGMKARKGRGPKPGFEGGQTPLYRRVPKRGFKPLDRRQWNEVNLDQLNRFEDGATVSGAELKRAGLLRVQDAPIKVLGRGKLDRKLNLEVERCSAGARAAVEAAGGSIKEI